MNFLRESKRRIVYSSTIGLEAAVRGISVIVAGEVHYARKGFTLDVDSKEQYTAILNDEFNDCESLSEEKKELARRYAFFYLYRTKIPLEFYKAERFKISTLLIRSYDELLPGRNPYLDLIMEGILNGKPITLSRNMTNNLFHLKD